MDVVDFWSRQVNKWNEDEKCDQCWVFGAPLINSQQNIQQTENPCCVHVFLTGITTNDVFQISQNTGFTNKKFCDITFTLRVLKQGVLGKNNYNEILGHPIEESNWNEIYKPIADCLDCNLILDFCELLGMTPQITQWRKEIEHAYLDNNYFGWRITGTFRIEQ